MVSDSSLPGANGGNNFGKSEAVYSEGKLLSNKIWWANSPYSQPRVGKAF